MAEWHKIIASNLFEVGIEKRSHLLRQQVTKRQKKLQLLDHHAKVCHNNNNKGHQVHGILTSSSPSPLSTGPCCTLPHCATMKNVLLHLTTCCQDVIHAKHFPFCFSSCELLAHWERCEIQGGKCIICEPIKQFMKWSRARERCQLLKRKFKVMSMNDDEDDDEDVGYESDSKKKTALATRKFSRLSLHPRKRVHFNV